MGSPLLNNRLTALVLVKATPISCKHVAVSCSRDRLIDLASAEYLNRDMTPLRENNRNVEIGDRIGTTLCIEEVEFV